MKEELSLEKLNGVKLWITAGPREKFTAAEVCCWSVVGGQIGWSFGQGNQDIQRTDLNVSYQRLMCPCIAILQQHIPLI